MTSKFAIPMPGKLLKQLAGQVGVEPSTCVPGAAVWFSTPGTNADGLRPFLDHAYPKLSLGALAQNPFQLQMSFGEIAPESP